MKFEKINAGERTKKDDLTMADIVREIFGDTEPENFYEQQQNPFELAAHLAKVDEQKAHKFIDRLAETGFLPKLFYEHESEGLTEGESEHELNLYRFGSSRENSHKEEMSELDKQSISYAISHLAKLRESFGLIPLNKNDIDQMIEVNTKPFENKSNGFGVVALKEPFIYISTPNQISSLKITFHELAHVFAYNKLRLFKNDSEEIDSAFIGNGLSREGGIDSKGRQYDKLTALNEAITEELSKWYNKAADENDPIFGEILKREKEKIERYRNEHSSELSSNEWEEVVAIHTLPDGTEYPAFFTYREERLMLHKMLEEMIKRLRKISSDFSNYSEKNLFDMLVKAQFTGDMGEFVKLFEISFGLGSWEQYFESKDREEAARVLTSLGVPNVDNLFQKDENH
jgi:hypothetical protein